MDEFIILVGNDINNIVPGNSWNDLLSNINNNLMIDAELTHDKPFPLFYEELFF